jgi:hypothetical protein
MGIKPLIKYVLLSIVTLFLVLTALSLLFPANLQVARVINVGAPREKIVAAINDLRAWNEWNEFLQGTTLTNKVYSSPSAGKGATLSSDQMIISETAADSNGVLLHWKLKSGKQVDGAIQILAVNADSLTVQWSFNLHFKWYPWDKLGVFVYDRKLGPVMEESLTGLKRFVENSR